MIAGLFLLCTFVLLLVLGKARWAALLLSIVLLLLAFVVFLLLLNPPLRVDL